MKSLTINNKGTASRFIFLILLLAAALYLFRLTGNGLWIDEFSSIQDAQTISERLITERFNSVRPVYYVLLKVWMLLGTSEHWLRGLSVLFGVGSVWLLYRLGRRVAGVAVGLIAAVLLACSPLVINHVQEVRMYALGNCLTLLSSLFLLEALDRPTVPNLVKWSLGRVLSTLTIPLSILLIPVDVVIVLWTFRQQRGTIVRFAVSMALSALLLVPPAVKMLTVSASGFASDWSAGLDKPGIASIVAKLTSFTVFWPLASLPNSLPIKAFYYGFTLLLAVLLLLGIAKIKRQIDLRWIFAWGFLPAAVMLLVSYLSSPIWSGRYLLYLSPYVMILLAVGFEEIWQRYRKAAIALSLIYVLALCGGWNQYYNNWNRDGWREAIQDIELQEMSGDTIAVYAPLKDPSLTVNYYYEGDAVVYPIGPFVGSVNEAEVERVLSDIPEPKESQRMWIVFRNINGNREANQLVAQGIEEMYAVVSESRFPGPITVFLVRSDA